MRLVFAANTGLFPPTYNTYAMLPLPPDVGKFEKGAVAWVSAIDPAAGKEGFKIANEVCAEENQVRRVCFASKAAKCNHERGLEHS